MDTAESLDITPALIPVTPTTSSSSSDGIPLLNPGTSPEIPVLDLTESGTLEALRQEVTLGRETIKKLENELAEARARSLQLENALNTGNVYFFLYVYTFMIIRQWKSCINYRGWAHH